MRCELYQMDRMEVDERFGSQTGDTMRRMSDINRRRRREAKMREDELNELVSDQCGNCTA